VAKLKPIAVAAALIVAGALVALLWVHAIGEREFVRGLARMDPTFLVPLLGATAAFLAVRFVRWQFLLRHTGIRIPTRPSLSVYLASLVGTATPAYVGEAVARGVLMRLRFGIGIGITVWVVLIERSFDVLALALIGLFLVASSGLTQTLAVLVVLAIAAVAFLIAVAPRALNSTNELGRPRLLFEALILSVAAWLPAAMLPWLAARSLAAELTPAVSAGVFSSSTLLGALTLMPAGFGTTGSFAVLQLESHGLSLTVAILVISVVRLTSTGAVLAVSLVFLVREALRSRRRGEERQHFDEIAAGYRAQFRPHVWDHLLHRKAAYMSDHLRPEDGVGLDVGCGLGQHCVLMGRGGFEVIGLDLAREPLSRARRDGVAAVAGSACELPFPDASFAFAYTIGVLHHLQDPEDQRRACAEVVRVLRPGGHFIVHETNPRNPLVRFYMGYVFPLLRRVDEGVENWIEPEHWAAMDGLRLLDVVHFTFLPDFIPAGLMKPARSVERWLEASRLRRYSVHYMAVLRKDDQRR